MIDNPGVRAVNQIKIVASSMNTRLQGRSDSHVDYLVYSIVERHIPAMLLVTSVPIARMLVFYHANAEDIGQAYVFCSDLNQKLDICPDIK